MKNSMFGWVIGFVLSLCASSASAVSVKVQATDDPWLAGMPSGSTASINDTSPGQSPSRVPGLHFVGGGYVTFSQLSGASSNTHKCCLSLEGGMMMSHRTGAENGISNVIAPLGSLIGVFLDDKQPSSSDAPDTLDFSGVGGLNFTTLSPKLKQVFFIGDGLASGTTLQHFYVPSGATRLFLGAMDGYEWNNNSGAFKVNVGRMWEVPNASASVVPESNTYALMLAGLTTIGCAVRRRRQ